MANNNVHASAPASDSMASGLGESFSINLNTGQGVYSQEITLPEGVAGFTPKIRLEYSSARKHTPFGWGWDINIRKIDVRKERRNAISVFLEGGQELLEIEPGVFAPKIEKAFHRYIKFQDRWELKERNGHKIFFGESSNARISDTNNPNRIHSYLISKKTDTNGNEIHYSYLEDEGQKYIDEINYSVYKISFRYEQRSDSRSIGYMGFKTVRKLRCKSINVSVKINGNFELIKQWLLTYKTSEESRISLLESLQFVGIGKAADGSENVKLAPAKFQYTSDKLDLSFKEIKPEKSSSKPPLINDPNIRLITLDNAPLPGLLHNVNGEQWYWKNNGKGSWRGPQKIGKTPFVDNFNTSGAFFLDTDGSGLSDMVVAGSSPLNGYFKNNGENNWGQFRAYPRGNKRSPNFRASVAFTDVNKDGLIDVLQNHNRSFALWENQGDQGWSEPLFKTKEDGLQNLDLSSPITRLVDMTGDGNADLVKIQSGYVEYWQNLGDGNFGERKLMGNSPRFQNLTQNAEQIFFIDINQSGCSDLVFFQNDRVTIYLNHHGKTFSEPIIKEGVLPALPDTILPVDFYGTGQIGLLYNSIGGKYVFLEFKDALDSHLLQKVSNGFGLESTINYKNAIVFYVTDFEKNEKWQTHFPFPLTVVESTEEFDQIRNHLAKISMQYHEAHFETRKRQFQGFRKVERIEHGDDSRPSSFEVHYYHSGEELLQGNSEEHASLNGLLQKKEVYSLEGNTISGNAYTVEEAKYSIQEIDPSLDGEKRYFISVEESVQKNIENTNDERIITKKYEYDEYGNVIKETKIGSGIKQGSPVEEKKLISEYKYSINESEWIIDRISKNVVKSEDGTVLSEVRNYYDGQDFVGLPLGQVTKGHKVRQEQMVLDKDRFDSIYSNLNISSLGHHVDQDDNGNQAVFINKERNSFDSRGLKTKEKDALGVVSSYTFDQNGLFKEEYTSSLGTTTYEYDLRVGKMTKVVNVDTTEMKISYDAMARTKAIFLPNNHSTTPSRTYDFDDSSLPIKRITKHYLSDNNDDFALVHTYFDGRLEEVQKKVEQQQNDFIVSAHQVKNPFGDVKEEYEQFRSNNSDFEIPNLSTLNKQTFKFDVLGRPVSSLNFFGGESTASYTPFVLKTKDPISNHDIPEHHSDGRFGLTKKVLVDVFNQRQSTIQETENGGDVRLDYLLSPLGEILEIHDGNGIQAKYLYDNLGNRLQVEHREAGNREACFNALGQPVRGIDANGNVITAEYEPNLHRLKKLLHDDEVKEEYTYDVAIQNSQAKLARVDYEGGSQTFFYDNAGRLTKKEYNWQGTNRIESVEYEFDRLGRHTKINHTDGTEKSYELYKNGWIKSIDGILNSIKYDSFGNPVEMEYENGVSCEREYTAGGRKVSSQITKKGNIKFEEFTYRYDVFGNMTQLKDVLQNKVTNYSYDSLEQVVLSETNGNTDYNYSYENNLNLSNFGEADKQLSYNDANHINRLSEITEAGNSFTVDYDLNGNLISLPGRQFTFNFRNELVKCEKDNGLVADYFYDHLGKRVRKIVVDGNNNTDTLFVGEEAEFKNSMKVYYYSIGKVRVAMKINGQKIFIHNNYLSSSGFFTDDNGTKISAISYKPFGNVHSRTGLSLPSTFAAHPYDEESGLFFMHKRYFAPEIGRFISPDLLAVFLPKKIIGDPVSMHCYAYAGNNPANNIDLDGTSFWSVLGGIVGAIVGVALAIFLGPLAAILIGIAVVGISYALASANVGNDFGEFMRGFMIGFNAGMNAVFATVLFGPVIGVAIGVINFLAVEESITRNPVYEGILGWTSWLMPMSWLVTGVGLLFFVINLIVAGVTLNQVPEVAITSIQIDWRRGMIGMEGGAIRAAGAGVAFNMGNFSFYDPGGLGATEHEIGHGLSLGAFGWAFHYIGAIDQAADPNFGGTGNVYAENIAESSDPAPRFGPPALDMWV